MRLIDADELIKTIQEREDAPPGWEGATFKDAFSITIMDIIALPTIDAVQVVRCKECKHWKKDIFQTGDNFVGICRRKAAIKSEFPCTADGFCKWAERRKA